MAEVVVCGAGIAGISTAFHLTRVGVTDVMIVDSRPPLSLTSDKSTECYRNWWPHEPMVQLMGRSIALLDSYARESGNTFNLNRRGYLYLTGDEDTLATMARQAAAASAAGAGELRIHTADAHSYQPADLDGFEDGPAGADLFMNGDLVRRQFPYLADRVVGGLHARTAGWLSAQQLGTWMLEEAVAAGARLVRSEVVRVDIARSRVRGVGFADGTTEPTTVFINASGPHLGRVSRLVGIELPVYSEVHAKIGFRDHQALFPREAPMVIWSDPQRIAWDAEEAGYLREAGRDDLLGDLPGGCHGRPEGGTDAPWVLGLWEYHHDVRDPVWPIPEDRLYTEVVVRGLTTMIPELHKYLERLPPTVVDGGYYTKTAENRPLAGPAGPTGSYVCGALSGFGIMAACGVGELVATAITDGPLPPYARWFDLRRYDDPAYVRSLESLGDSGQL